jgi:hypothetical protein
MGKWVKGEMGDPTALNARSVPIFSLTRFPVSPFLPWILTGILPLLAEAALVRGPFLPTHPNY